MMTVQQIANHLQERESISFVLAWTDDDRQEIRNIYSGTIYNCMGIARGLVLRLDNEYRNSCEEYNDPEFP